MTTISPPYIHVYTLHSVLPTMPVFTCLLLLLPLTSSYRLSGHRVLPPPEKYQQPGGNLTHSDLVTIEKHEFVWFNQTLDHFRPADTRVWPQRYGVNWQHYQKGGPALLMIGGEGEENPSWLSGGAWFKYAQDQQAAMFILEHRYYGKSRPTADMSVKNLAWLSADQALADIANFRVAMSEQHNITGPWVALGGSYPGSLAAWLRLKYPHLFAGTVSSSGPLHAKPDFFEYLEVVADSLDSTSPGCNANVVDAIVRIMNHLRQKSGVEHVSKMFKLCTQLDPSNQQDMAMFMESLMENVEDIVQYNKDNRKDNDINITTVCDVMKDASLGCNMMRFAAVNQLIINKDGNNCMEHRYNVQLSGLQNATWPEQVDITKYFGAVGNRPWFYQTCTEFGWYQSSDQPGHPYGKLFPVDKFETMCSQVFGPKYNGSLLDQGVANTNRQFGGTDIAVTNVVFVQGSIDPWHALGITEDLSDDSPAIMINGTSHCANLYQERDTDLQELKDARNRVGNLIAKWIAEAQN